jgi:hypothetical protein
MIIRLAILGACALAAAAAYAEVEVVHSDYGTLNVAGYALGRYTWQDGELPDGHSTATSTFTLRSASVIMSGNVFEYAGYMVYFDAALSPALMDAYGTFKAIPQTELRMGQFLVPFGRESCTSTSKILFCDRSMATAAIAPPMGRDVGAQAEVTLKPEGRNYWGAFALAGVNGTGPNQPDENAPKDLAFRVMGNPLSMDVLKSLTLEAYYYYGKPDVAAMPAGIGTEPRFGVAAAFDHDLFSLQGEYLTRSLTLAGNDEREEITLKRGGYYLQGSYKWALGAAWLQTIEPCARWEAYDPDKDADDDASTAVTGGVNFHFDGGHHCKLLLNYESIGEQGDAVDNDKASAQFQVRF